MTRSSSKVRPVAVPVAPTSGEDVLNIAELERRAIIQALRKTGGNRKDTADLLGISIRTLRNKLNGPQRAGVADAYPGYGA